MARYTITLLGPFGGFHSRFAKCCADDDEAIDLAGWLSHPHGILIHQGRRLVAAFPDDAGGDEARRAAPDDPDTASS